MRVTVITPPEPIVSLVEAKRHLRVEHDSDDAHIQWLIEVATSWIDAPDSWLGRALGEQTLEATLPACWKRAGCELPYPPFRELVSETPAEDGRTTVVRWKAGYPQASGKSTVPAAIRHAILLMVGHLYAHPDAVTLTTAKPEKLPLGVEALLSGYQVMSV
jgi:hypothetical protein